MAQNDAIVHIPSPIAEVPTQKLKPTVTVESVEVDEKASRPELHKTKSKGRRKTHNHNDNDQLQVGWDGEPDTVKKLGILYDKIIQSTPILRYAFYILPVAILLAIPAIIVGVVYNDVEIHDIRLFGFFVWLEMVWISLWMAKICSKALPHIFQFLCGIVSASTRKYAELIRALEVPLSIVVWVIICWASVPVIKKINSTMDSVNDTHHTTDLESDQATWVDTLRRIILATIPVVCVFFVEKLIIQLLAIDYHRKQFRAKINETKKMIGLIIELYKASRVLAPPYSSDFFEDDVLIFNNAIANGLNRTPSAQVRLLGGLARAGNGVTSVFANIVSEVSGKQTERDTDQAVVIAALERKVSSEALARRLWFALAAEGNEALYEADLVRVFGEDRKTDVEHMFTMLDKDGNGDVSLEEMEMMLVAVERKQKAMVRSMHDVKQSVAALDRILECAVLVAAALIYASFFSQTFVTHITIMISSLMSFSFAFAGTVQEFAGSCIFLFIKHPYDVGDRIDINGTELYVEHISLLYTVFRRVDTNRKVQIPNIVNNATWIENVSRSGPMKERLSITIDPGTTSEDIDALHEELNTFVTAPENKREYQPHTLVDVSSVGDMKTLELLVEFGHKSNWADEAKRAKRRATFMTALLAAMRRVPIYGPGCGDASLGSSDNANFSVAITAEEAQAKKDEYAAKKEAKRIVVQKKALDALDEDDEEDVATAKPKSGSDNNPWRRRSAVRHEQRLDAAVEGQSRRASEIRPASANNAPTGRRATDASVAGVGLAPPLRRSMDYFSPPTRQSQEIHPVVRASYEPSPRRSGR